MDLLDKQLSKLNGEIDAIANKIEQLYGRLDSEQDTSLREDFKERITKLEKKETELDDRRRKLEDKLQPGGMPSKVRKDGMLISMEGQRFYLSFAVSLRLSSTTSCAELAEDMKKLLILTEMNNKLHTDSFLYTEGKISQRSGHFGEKVKKVYKAQAGPNCWCLLTNDVLPKQTVIGAHLFKHEWKERTDIIGIDDIDDTRNGLPLWRPIEWAFDTSR